MLTKFFNKMDALPVVRILQGAAVMLFIAGVVRLIEDGHQVFGNTFVNEGMIVHAFMLLQSAILKSLYQPMLLLGLAEIIKIKKEVK